MKILISPSKSKNMFKSEQFSTQRLIFKPYHSNLKQLVSKIDTDTLNKKLKIPTTKSYFTNKKGHAIFSYTGEQFKAFDVKTLDPNDFDYIRTNLLIFSAYYGLVKPFNLIDNYYLDFTSKLLDSISLRKYWQEQINNYLNNELVINLASQEFSSCLKNYINISFYNQSNNLKVHSVKAKQMRGLVARQLIKERVQTVDSLIECLNKNYPISQNDNNIIVYV